MKKITILLTMCIAALCSSCSHSIYNAKTLQGNYDIRMDTQEELEIKGKVRIFWSENDVVGDYDIIAINQYSPLLFPKSQISKKFFEQAVKKAYELGGNGIIITAGGFYQVISLYNWDSDNAESAALVNAILDTSLMDKFNKGEVAKLTPREVKRHVTDLNNEIKFNIQCMKTSEEATIVGNKISCLMNWNNTQAKRDGKLTKTLDAYKELHETLQKKILKKEAKNKKKESKNK